MFKNKTKANFLFSYACRDYEKSVAFSITDGKASANWYDANQEHHSYENVPVTEGFWQALEDATQSVGAFQWKAYKLYSHFALNLDTSAFNAEGHFPTGKSFAANNYHGEPSGFSEAIEAYKALFATLE